MLKDHFMNGQRDALARFKLSNLNAGSQAYNPTLNGQSGGGALPSAPTAAPTSAAAPMAAGVAKSKVLG